MVEVVEHSGKVVSRLLLRNGTGSPDDSDDHDDSDDQNGDENHPEHTGECRVVEKK